MLGVARLCVVLRLEGRQCLRCPSGLPAGGKPYALEAALQAADITGEILSFANATINETKTGGGREESDARPDGKQVEEAEDGGVKLPPGLEEVRAQVQKLQGDVELIQTLLGQRVGCVLEEVQQEEGTQQLLQRLVRAELYLLAVYCAENRRCRVAWAWEQWGFALMEVGWVPSRCKPLHVHPQD